MNTGLLKQGFRVTAYWLNKLLKVPTLSFHAGIAEDRLLGFPCLPPRLPGAVYHDFLRNVLPELLKDVDPQTMVHVWWCSAIFLLAVREFLNSVFPEQWVGRGGPTAWPALSPDLFTSHLYLWRHLKSTVCATEVSDVQDKQQRKQNGFDMIRATPGIFQRDGQSLFRRAGSYAWFRAVKLIRNINNRILTFPLSEDTHIYNTSTRIKMPHLKSQ